MKERIKFTAKILSITAILMLLHSNVYAAQDNQMTVPHQYPAKYTPEYIQQIRPNYKSVGKDEVFYVALDMLKDTEGMFSRNAILGNNLSERPVKIEFKNLGEIKKEYEEFDALGWKKGKNLYIYINIKHQDALPVHWQLYYLMKHYIRMNLILLQKKYMLGQWKPLFGMIS